MQNGLINMGVNADAFVQGMAQITQNFNHCTVQMNQDLHALDQGFDDVRQGIDQLNHTVQQSGNQLTAIFERQAQTANQVTEAIDRQGRALQQFANGAVMRLGAAAVEAIGNIFRTGIQATRVFEDMASKMSALTGSLDSAKDKFWELNALEDETTIATDKLSQAFITLGNNALNNSSKQLKAYSAIAIGTGKDLNQLSDAIVKFSQGRMNALAQFGITAKENANSITMSYRGVTTEIEKNTKALEKYLSDIANNNFDGVLAEKYNTVEASMNRLDNAWGTFCAKIMQSDGGFGELIIMGNDFLSTTLNDISDWFNQPDVIEWFHEVGDIGRSALDTVGTAWGTLKDTAKTVVDYLQAYWSNFCQTFEDLGIAAFADLKNSFTDFLKLVAQGINTVMTTIQTAMKMLRNTGEEIGKRFAPDQKEALINAQWKYRVEQGLEDTNNAARYAEFKKEQRKLIQWADSESLATKNAKELQSAIDKLDASAKKLFSGSQDRALAKALENSKKPLETPPDNKPIGKPDEQGGGTTGGKGGGGSSRLEADRRAFDQLAQSLERAKVQSLSALQQEEIEYQKHMATITDALNRRVVSEQEAKALLEQVEFQHQENLNKIRQDAEVKLAEMRGDPIAKLQMQYSQELEALEQLHADKLASEEVYLQSMTALYDRYYGEMSKKNEKDKKGKGKDGKKDASILGISTEALDSVGKSLDMVSGAFSQMTANMNESSGAYKALFAVEKSFALASAMVNGMAAIGKGMSTAKTWYEWAAVYAQAIAMVGNIVSTISSVSMHDKGGTIPAGQYGIVGEIGPELVRGPASVTSRKDTADLLSQRGESNIVVNLIEDASRAGQVEKEETDEATIIQVCVANIHRGGELADAISNTYGVARQGV